MSDSPVPETAITAAAHALEPWMPEPDISHEERMVPAREILAAAAPHIDAAARASERETIRQLHRPVSRGRVMNCCEGCESVNGEFHDDCCHEWPCPTIDLIEREPQ